MPQGDHGLDGADGLVTAEDHDLLVPQAVAFQVDIQVAEHLHERRAIRRQLSSVTFTAIPRPWSSEVAQTSASAPPSPALGRPPRSSRRCPGDGSRRP